MVVLPRAAQRRRGQGRGHGAGRVQEELPGTVRGCAPRSGAGRASAVVAACRPPAATVLAQGCSQADSRARAVSELRIRVGAVRLRSRSLYLVLQPFRQKRVTPSVLPATARSSRRRAALRVVMAITVRHLGSGSGAIPAMDANRRRWRSPTLVGKVQDIVTTHGGLAFGCPSAHGPSQDLSMGSPRGLPKDRCQKRPPSCILWSTRQRGLYAAQEASVAHHPNGLCLTGGGQIKRTTGVKRQLGLLCSEF